MKRLLTAILALAPALAFAEFAGQPMVMDGDTVRFGEREVTLHGVHAPTITQNCGSRDNVWSCGWDAALYLEEAIGADEVVCSDIAETGAGLVGRCSAAGRDLAGAMIDAGLAVPDEDRGAEYLERAAAAERDGVGMWSGPFVDPVTWAQYGGCSCSARKQAMMDNAELLKQMKEEDEAAATE